VTEHDRSLSKGVHSQRREEAGDNYGSSRRETSDTYGSGNAGGSDSYGSNTAGFERNSRSTNTDSDSYGGNSSDSYGRDTSDNTGYGKDNNNNDGISDYKSKPSLGEKIGGTFDQIKGAVTKNPELKEEGRLRKQGEYSDRSDNY